MSIFCSKACLNNFFSETLTHQIKGLLPSVQKCLEFSTKKKQRKFIHLNKYIYTYVYMGEREGTLCHVPRQAGEEVEGQWLVMGLSLGRDHPGGKDGLAQWCPGTANGMEQRVSPRPMVHFIQSYIDS